MKKIKSCLSRISTSTGGIVGALVILIVALATVAWQKVNINPLPHDEEMIAHFRAHKADIEALAKRYREYRLPPGEKPRYWAATPETEALMKKAGVEDVNYIGALWFPNPYSVETAKQIDSLLRRPHDEYLFWQYGALRIRPADPRYYTKSLRYLTDFAIWKDFEHIPEVPKIENGRLWYPVGVDGKLKYGNRLLSSLNDYPSGWKRGECVFRRIETETHWFIRMCRAA